MNAHLFHLPSTNAISRFSICLALLVAFGPYADFPFAWQSHLSVAPQVSAPAPGHLQPSHSPLAIAQFLQLVRVSPGDANDSLSFGYSVAMEGDTIVVGAYWDHHLVTGGGSAYVFVKPEAGWPAITQVAKLTASDTAFHDRFGWSVAISGNTIVVGAPNDNSTGMSDHGSAYVFVKPESGWVDMTQTAKLTASDKQSLDEFGRDLAVSGDMIAVGAHNDDIGSNQNQGSAYVFVKPVAGWITATETTKLMASDGIAGDLFGASIALSGDTVVAGAYAHDSDQVNASGKAYVFIQPGDTITATEDARLTASDKADREYFGWSAAIDGDLVVIGAPGETTFDNSGVDSAYVFTRPVGGWSGDLTETAILTASDGDISDNFGHSVAISGEYVVVGAPYDDAGINDNRGSAYFFARPDSGWVSMTETDKLLASDGTDNDEFGHAVSVSGSTVAIGVPEDDVNVVNDNIGSVYIFGYFPVPDEYIYLPIIVR